MNTERLRRLGFPADTDADPVEWLADKLEREQEVSLFALRALDRMLRRMDANRQEDRAAIVAFLRRKAGHYAPSLWHAALSEAARVVESASIPLRDTLPGEPV
jgi:hypothetical protein